MPRSRNTRPKLAASTSQGPVPPSRISRARLSISGARVNAIRLLGRAGLSKDSRAAAEASTTRRSPSILSHDIQIPSSARPRQSEVSGASAGGVPASGCPPWRGRRNLISQGGANRRAARGSGWRGPTRRAGLTGGPRGDRPAGAHGVGGQERRADGPREVAQLGAQHLWGSLVHQEVGQHGPGDAIDARLSEAVPQPAADDDGLDVEYVLGGGQ